MTNAELDERLFDALGGEVNDRVLQRLTATVQSLRKQWLADEREAILRLVSAWIGDTVEGRDLVASIRYRNK